MPNCPHNGGKRIIDNVWQPIVLSYEHERRTSDENASECCVKSDNISDKERAKDVEHFDDK